MLKLRALVVEPNAETRHQVVQLLEHQGVLAQACADVEQGRQLFDEHSLVVAPVNGDNRVVIEFVHWLRSRTGRDQPYILGLGDYVAPPDQWHGFNELLPHPLDYFKMHLSVEAARRWHDRSFTTPAMAPEGTPQNSVPDSAPAETTEAEWNWLQQAASPEDEHGGDLTVHEAGWSGAPTLAAWNDDSWQSPIDWELPEEVAEAPLRTSLDADFWQSAEAQEFADSATESSPDEIWKAEAPSRIDGTEEVIPKNEEKELETRSATSFSAEHSSFESSLLAALLRQDGPPIVVVNLQGLILQVNATAEAFSSCPNPGNGQTYYWDAFVPDSVREDCLGRFQDHAAACIMREAFAFPDREDEICHSLGQDGDARPTSWLNLPYEDAQGKLLGVIRVGSSTPAKSTVVTGVAEVPVPPPAKAPLSDPLALAELLSKPREISSKEVLFQQITESAPFGLLLLDDAANVLYANPQMDLVLGRSVADAGGLHEWLTQGVATDSANRKRTLDEWWERVWKRRFSFVVTMRNRDGILKEIEFRPAPMDGSRLLVAVFDVTDARRDEEAMRSSEARFRSLFSQAAAGIVVLNASGNITDANPTFERLTGASRLEVRRIGLERFFPTSDAPAIAAAVRAARDLIPGQAAPMVQTTLQPLDKPALPVSLSVSVVKNVHGAPVFTAYYLHPLPVSVPSAAESTTSAMASTIQVHPNLVEVVPDLVVELTPDLSVVRHTKSRDFTTLTPPDANFTGMTFASAFPALADLIPLGEMKASLDEVPGSEVRSEFDLSLPEYDDPRFCEARMAATADSSGQKSGYGLVVRDLTRMAEKVAARLSEQRQNADSPGSFGFSAIRLLRQAAVVTNEKGRISEVNPAAEALFGYPRSELIGSGLYVLFLPQQPKEFARRISEHINLHRCWIGKSTYFRKDGSTGRLSVELVPYEENGQRGFLGFMRDITGEEKPSQPPMPREIDPSRADLPKSAPRLAPGKPGSEVGISSGAPMVTLHRARNDLQVLSSLLSMQAADKSLDSSAKIALQEGKDRISAVALVYRLLDATTGAIRFQPYAQELGSQLLRSHRIGDDRVTIICRSEAHVPQKLAIPLGIILHELLLDSVRYSIPADSHGIIEISLEMNPEEGVLVVKDDAPLHSDSTRQRRLNSFGWQVVEALSDQIRGHLTVRNELENEVRLRFRI